MSILKQKQVQLDKLRREVWDLREADRIKRGYPKAKALVGTYWKYRNCYSCPQGEGDYWWLYKRIVKAAKGGSLYANEFQTDKHGAVRFSIGKEEAWNDKSPGDGWVKISAQEWGEALQKMHKTAKAL